MTSATRPSRSVAPRRTVLARLAVLPVVALLCAWLVLGGPGTQDGPGSGGEAVAGGSGDGVRSSARSFTVSGTVTGRLVPGTRQPLNLSIHNHTRKSLSVTGLTVTVKAVVAPRADPRRPCTTADFAATQLRAAYPLTVRTGRTDLLALGLPPEQWPTIHMLNTARNQDGCIGARLRLGFTGTSRADRS